MYTEYEDSDTTRRPCACATARHGDEPSFVVHDAIFHLVYIETTSSSIT